MEKNPNEPATKGDLDSAISELKDEIITHFNFVAEQIRHDVGGANADEISVLDDRVTRLEQHTGLTKTQQS